MVRNKDQFALKQAMLVKGGVTALPEDTTSSGKI
jgi:hypothetical protein